MKGSRRNSRELALQGLYQWLVNQTEADEILAQAAEQDGFARCDREYLEMLVRSVIRDGEQLREQVS
ncbi:MAG: transcription antitermination factor NusB, partial [Burkholderiales bacterium]